MITIEENLYNKMPKDIKVLFKKSQNPERDEVMGLFPNTKSGIIKPRTVGKPTHKGSSFPSGARTTDSYFGGDSGSAARFFYCAKASKSERNAGLEGMEEKQTWASQEKRESNSFDVFESDGRPKTLNQNNHPTVKPIALMRYLCRLITPPKGIVLDLYAGSGSTLVAAECEGFQFIGFELDRSSCEIAEKRIEHEQSQLKLTL